MTTKIYKNHVQRGHYYVFTDRGAVEIVLGSITHVQKLRLTKEDALETIQSTPKMKGFYDFQESSFLDILVVTGITEEEIYEAMEVH